MATSTAQLEIAQVNDVTVVTFVDNKILEEGIIDIIGNDLYALVETDGRKKIVVDFKDVVYISSALLGKLISLQKKVTKAKGALRLCSIYPDIYELFSVTRLNKLIYIKENLEKALEGM